MSEAIWPLTVPTARFAGGCGGGVSIANTACPTPIGEGVRERKRVRRALNSWSKRMRLVVEQRDVRQSRDAAHHRGLA